MTPREAKNLGGFQFSHCLHMGLSTETEVTLSRSKDCVQRVVLADEAQTSPLPILLPVAVSEHLGTPPTEPGQGLKTLNTELSKLK